MHDPICRRALECPKTEKLGRGGNTAVPSNGVDARPDLQEALEFQQHLEPFHTWFYFTSYLFLFKKCPHNPYKAEGLCICL